MGKVFDLGEAFDGRCRQRRRSKRHVCSATIGYVIRGGEHVYGSADSRRKHEQECWA